MRHHVQEKRKQRKMSHETSVDQTPGQVVWQVRTDPENGAESSFEAPLSSTQDSIPDKYPTTERSSQPTMALQIPSPITMLDASRKDPFRSLPIICNRQDQELMDSWMTKLTYWSGQNHYLKNQIFQTAREHPLSFQAVVLAYSARWKALLDREADSKEIRRHVGQASKLIEDASAGSTQVKEDNLAVALAGMALHEERFGNKQLAQTYVDRAVQIVRPKTGSNMPVEVFLQYIRYILMPHNTAIDPAERRWLIDFLRGAEGLMRKQSTPEYLAHTPRRREAFQMESPLFPLLSSGPRPSQVPPESRMYVVRDAETQEVSRTAALIYITAALWEFQDSPDKTTRFLAHLYMIVRQHQLDRYPACETLLWLLLEEGYEPDLRNPGRGWWTGELLRMHKQLRPDLQFHFNEILMSFLTLNPPIRGIDAFEDGLEVCNQRVN